MEDGVGFIGLHGMGGVGKTTLFKKINNKFAEISDTFDVVIWVVVSQGAQISKLQEDIAEKLNLYDEVWKKKRESDKATDIYRVLKGKRFVLMLDDIWEKVDLEAIGVPFPTTENGCKVAFTTRSRDVCGSMGDHEPMEVKCLEWNEAWELFKNKVGDMTLSLDIVKQAKKVAEKCRGLPLALSVIGETMAAKTTVQEWDHAIKVLTRSAAEFSNMDNKILPILKFSYDSLKDEHIKLCFLYCALFPEDDEISKETLIDYWICEGFIGEDDLIIKEAMNKGYDVLGTLIRANLLMEVGTGEVKMHDLVREMITISTELGLKQLSDDQRLAKCTQVLGIEGFQQKPLDVSSLLASMENLCELRVENSHVWEINTDIKCREIETNFSDLQNLTRPCFTNLSRVVIVLCNDIKDLTWLLFAPNLVHLNIVGSADVEEIINKEKATNLTRITPFLKLERLYLERLPKLESIYWSPLPFPFLKEIIPFKCPKLRKLPLNATSVPRLEEFKIIIHPRKQKTEVEWEDEDTKNRFLPLIKVFN